jgi:hypothetical protein
VVASSKRQHISFGRQVLFGVISPSPLSLQPHIINQMIRAANTIPFCIKILFGD